MAFHKINGMEEIEVNKSSSSGSSKQLSPHINLMFQGGREPFVTNKIGQKKRRLTGTFFQGKPRKTARASVIYIKKCMKSSPARISTSQYSPQG